MTVSIKFMRLAHSNGLPLPAYETESAAGMDLRAALADPDTLELAPGERKLVPTGLCMELPQGYEAQVRPRSGLAIKHGMTLINTPGTIDADYRGELMVPMVNLGSETFTITHGMRIAQMIIAPVIQALCEEADSLSPTPRGKGGFGSTGT